MFDKFNLGLLDFLTLVLPGGLMVGLAWKAGWISEWRFFEDPNFPDWVSGAIFASSAYVIGHFVYLIASYLDDLVFDKIKEIWWPKNSLFTQANGIRSQKIKEVKIKDFNNFKYALGYLLQNNDSLYSVVERLIAESKFFRSFSIVLLLATIVAFQKGDFQEGSLSLVLMVFSMIRYLSQRAKSIDVAYQYLILLHEEKLSEFKPLEEDGLAGKKTLAQSFLAKMIQSLRQLFRKKS